MRSILTKIFSLFLGFNVVLWVFVLASDDFVTAEITHKKNQLSLSSVLYAQLALPIIRRPDISEFEKQVTISQLLSGPAIPSSENIRVYRFEAEGDLPSWFKYYNGTAPNRLAPVVTVSVLPASKLNTPSKTKLTDQIAERLFKVYKPLVDGRVVTPEIVAKRARFSIQSEVLDSDLDSYFLRVLAPIRDGKETVGVIEVWDTYKIKDAYFGRNAVRLNLLGGISLISLILCLILAISIAVPLRRLSRRLDKKLSPDDIATQLQGFRIKSLSKRRDEIGKLHGNLVKLTSQMTDLFKEKEQFAAEVSHELKNPIASIIAYAENSEGHSEVNDNVLAKVKAQAVRMNKLVSEISEAAVVDNDLVSKKRERFNLSEMLDEILTHYQDTNEYKGVEIIAEIHPKVVISGLQERWGQVVVNLLDNAISFTRPVGRVHVSLSKSWRRGVILQVEDSGPGISEAATELVFERFYSARKGNASQSNASGLGLSLVKQIVEAHGGDVKAGKSDLGGAKFTITL